VAFRNRIDKSGVGIMKTGTDVVYTGLYSSDCCLVEAELKEGKSFPRCPQCMKLAVWMDVSLDPDYKAA